MRLWHEDLISKLPYQQLLGQHRECCSLRGNGWKKKHATINYIFQYPFYKLYQYHKKVMEEMKLRGYHPDDIWMNTLYRGKQCTSLQNIHELPQTYPIYPEHNQHYKLECLNNLKEKGIIIK